DPAALGDFLVSEIPRLLRADAAALLFPEGDAPGQLVFRAAYEWPGNPVGRAVAVDETAGPGYALHRRQAWQSERGSQTESASSDADDLNARRASEDAHSVVDGGADANGRTSEDAHSVVDSVEQNGWLAEGLDSYAFVPLLIGGGAIGVLGLGSHGARQLDDDELRFARLLANQAALSFEQVRLHRLESQGQRMERELQQARRIQMSLLPGRYPEIAGWDFAATYESAREIGGDLYDFIEWPDAPERIGLLIADVSGKGTAAALFMAHSRAMIRGAAQTRPSPADTLSQANVLIARDNHAMLFVSAFYAVLDTGSGHLTFANAGHNVPLLLRASGDLEEVMCRGMVLGIMDDMTYDEDELVLAPGDTLVLYTDGITEAMDATDELFGKARLKEAIAGAAVRNARDAIDAIITAIRTYTGDTPQADDLTVVAIRRETVVAQVS
uniref:PP2C family protein-serine/threonine phosphatase n=1 Tax=Promineifilum sp. TaxID=2664178 RepID=UPI0035B40D1F